MSCRVFDAILSTRQGQPSRQIVLVRRFDFMRVRYDMGSTAGLAAASAEGSSYTAASSYRTRSPMEHSVGQGHSEADSLRQVAYLFG